MEATFSSKITNLTVNATTQLNELVPNTYENALNILQIIDKTSIQIAETFNEAPFVSQETKNFHERSKQFFSIQNPDFKDLGLYNLAFKLNFFLSNQDLFLKRLNEDCPNKFNKFTVDYREAIGIAKQFNDSAKKVIPNSEEARALDKTKPNNFSCKVLLGLAIVAVVTSLAIPYFISLNK